MKAKKVYEKLNHDFITENLTDDWAQYMGEIDEFLCDNFKERSMGLVCDNTKEINFVYCAVFPTPEVMQYILDSGMNDVLLFTHHPSNWDVTKSPPFYQMERDLLQQFRDKNIALYNLHVPLDAFGPYSTSTTFANALGLDIDKPFAPYRGGLAGVIGRTQIKTVQELEKKFADAVGHKVRLYNYGADEIVGGKVAVLAGGGNEYEIIQEVKEKGVNTVVVGISVKNDFSQKVHKFEEENGINLLGGTHYSTEKFACQAMCGYFEKMGLKSEFIEGVPQLDDL